MKIYNAPKNYEKISSAFKVMCGDREISVFDCDVSAYPLNQVWPGYQRPFEQTEPSSYLSVGCNGKVLLDITPEKEFKEVVVRPLSKNIKPEIKDGVVTVMLPGPGQYSIEFDGTHHVLTAFVNPLKSFDDIDENDDNVIYFGAGVHYIDKPIELKDNQTVYIDEDAVVYGGIKAVDKKNVSIIGYGILDNSNVARGAGCTVAFTRCRNVHVEGITVVNSCGWSMHYAGCTNVTVDNIKLIGMWRYNSDGCDFTNCTNAVIRNSYLRNYDDCIVIKGLNGNRTLPLCNNYAENCVLWCDWGRALELGAETCAPTFSQIKFKNCDIIHGDSVMMDLQHGDLANFSNIYFEDIRVEYTAKAMAPIFQKAPGEVYVNHNEKHMPLLVYVSTIHTMWSTDNKTGNIENVHFKNITVTTEDGRIPKSFIGANAADTTVSGIHFENIVVNGKKITDFAELNVEIGDASDVTIK